MQKISHAWNKIQLWLILSCVVMIFTGCSMCEWTPSTPYPHDRDEIWRTLYEVVDKRHEIFRASQEKYELETEWREQVSMRYLEGYRTKVFAKIEPYVEVQNVRDTSKPLDLDAVEDTRPKYIVKVCALREQNRNMDNPAVASEADWCPAGTDYDEVGLVLTFLSSRLAIKLPSTMKPSKSSPEGTKSMQDFATPSH